MKIHLLINDGSPIGITLKDLWGEGNRGIGVGGSEYALLTLCEEWHNAGHEVILYNNPITKDGSPFEQRKIDAFDPNENRDILIIFRSPNFRSLSAKGLKVWFSCDQYTVGDFANFASTVNKIVCISSYHAQFFAHTYRIIDNVEVIDLPVRINDLKLDYEIERVPYRMIFTSVPDRGLHILRRYWNEISELCPEVSLVITSDYRLWGADELIENHRIQWICVPNVSYLGAINRKRLIEEQLKAEILAYPGTYEELFCIAVAEAQCAGIYPITSSMGALATTNMGTIIAGNPIEGIRYQSAFVDKLSQLLKDRESLKKVREEVQQKALVKFDPKRILKLWDEKIFK